MPMHQRSRIGYRLSLAWLLLLLAIPAGVGAVPVENLYTVEVPVPTRDRPERQEAFKAGLSQVLVRVIGARSLEPYAGLDSLLETASRYVQRFEYMENRRADGRADEENPYRLRVTYDGPALERAVAERSLPVWGRDRPGVLVWLAVTERSNRYLVGGDSLSPARRALDGVARERGLALLYPLLDIEDQSRVTFADITGGFHEAVHEASRRYRPEATLIAQVAPLSGGWEARWTLSQGEQPLTWTSRGANLQAALAEGLHEMADTLARRNASSRFAEMTQGLLVTVHDVRSHAELNRVSDYLAGLAPVASARPFGLQGDTVEMLVQMRGEARDLQRLVMLGNVLVSEERQDSPMGPGGQAASPAFRLLR